jgi:hypothetical protein
VDARLGLIHQPRKPHHLRCPKGHTGGARFLSTKSTPSRTTLRTSRRTTLRTSLSTNLSTKPTSSRTTRAPLCAPLEESLGVPRPPVPAVDLPSMQGGQRPARHRALRQVRASERSAQLAPRRGGVRVDARGAHTEQRDDHALGARPRGLTLTFNRRLLQKGRGSRDRQCANMSASAERKP